MPKMNIEQPEYYKGEFYGSPNSGKSRIALSICYLMLPDSRKNKIIYLTNESTWKSSIKDFPDYESKFYVYYHSDLNELRADWNALLDEYTIEHPKTHKKQFNYHKFESEVFAIVLDEGEYIYREGFVKEFIELQKKIYPQYTMRPADWGDPRAEFIKFTKSLYSKPCHVFITSKVGFEYEGVRHQKADGSQGSLTFEKTGNETYRLPDAQEYEPNVRMHLFSSERDRINDEPEFDDASELIIYYNYWGRIVKNKSDRDRQPVIKNPDMKKVKSLLDRMRRMKLKQLGN